MVAKFGDSGPELIPNALGNFLTPSAVFIDKSGEAVIGASAKDHLMINSNASTSKFKRYMGTNQLTKLNKKNFRPEDLSALILRALKADAEIFTGEKITEAVISVPAYFNDIQRKATVAAAEIAGLQVQRLINEPTAAALAYGLQDKEGENTFLIVDLGGGTFDVSILEMFSGVMEVRSSAGDAFLGGEDFTDRITKEFLKKIEVNKEDMSSDDLARLRSIAEKAKHLLGENIIAEVVFGYKDHEHKLSISRDKLEEITSDLINRMKIPLQRAISDAGLKADEIDRIVLVGGATRMGLVRNLITKLFKRFPEHELDPDTVVAMGAAVQAGLLERNEALEELVMTDVCPFTLGYETTRQLNGKDKYEYGVFSPLIERNTTVPVSRNHEITAMQKRQTQIEINVYQGEAPYVRDNIKIGSYLVSIPYNINDYEKADIRFTYDNSGVLEVICKVLSTGKETKLIIESNPGALSSKEIQQRFKELEKIKIHPRDEAVNEALVARISAAYANALGDKRLQIQDLLSHFEATLSSFDKRQIEITRLEIEEQLKYLEDNNVFE